MTKKILTSLLLIGMLGLVGIWTIRADNFLVDSTIATPYYSSVHFWYGGNDFAGLFIINGTIDIASGQTISMTGNADKTCFKQIKGYYFNPQRGNRMRPLDEQSLAVLSGMNGSYANLQLTGGLFTNCSGDVISTWGFQSRDVYGQITHTYAGIPYKLLGGVQYRWDNGYTGAFDDTLQFQSVQGHYSLFGMIWDIQWGTAELITNMSLYEGNGLLFPSGLLAWAWEIIDLLTYFYSTTLSWYVLFSWVTFTVTGADWNGVIVPPTIVVGAPAATPGEAWLPTYWTIYMTIQAGATWTSLVATPPWYFTVSFLVGSGTSGLILNVYRSQDGTNWTWNTPDSFCILDSAKMCTFRTDHLTYFTVITAPSDGNRTTIYNAQTCGDPDGCRCNGSPIASGANCVIVPPSWGGGGGSFTLTIDDCKRDSAHSINLPGANDEGIDYSDSYYDRDCSEENWEAGRSEEEEIIDLGSIEDSPYSYDLNQAYLYGYKYKLTMASTIQRAGMKATMTRKNLAIMMAWYAMRVLWLEPDSTKKWCDKFTDTKKLDGDSQLYVMWSCQLWLMGLDTNGKVLTKFRPTEPVTRAHFSAIFSRLLFADKYDGGKPYYEKHIAGLASHGIIKSKQNPQMKERKGYVMLMMMRADTKDVGRAKYHASAPENGALALLSQ